MNNAFRRALIVVLAVAAMSWLPAAAQARDWPWLGVMVTDINRFNVDGYEGGGSGAFVTGIEDEGPALAAGLRRHDIIVAVDGKAALNTRALTCLIHGRRPGDTVSVTVMRDGRRYAVSVTLGAWPATDLAQPAPGNCGREPVS